MWAFSRSSDQGNPLSPPVAGDPGSSWRRWEVIGGHHETPRAAQMEPLLSVLRSVCGLDCVQEAWRPGPFKSVNLKSLQYGESGNFFLSQDSPAVT